MTTYLSLVDITDREFQNAQELASLWGEITPEIEEHGGELLHSWAALGSVDFVVVFEVEDDDAAFQVALAMERHGLDTQTMPVEPTDDFADIVEDI